jgi:hypothetical protein
VDFFESESQTTLSRPKTIAKAMMDCFPSLGLGGSLAKNIMTLRLPHHVSLWPGWNHECQGTMGLDLVFEG